MKQRFLQLLLTTSLLTQNSCFANPIWTRLPSICRPTQVERTSYYIKLSTHLHLTLPSGIQTVKLPAINNITWNVILQGGAYQRTTEKPYRQLQWKLSWTTASKMRGVATVRRLESNTWNLNRFRRWRRLHRNHDAGDFTWLNQTASQNRADGYLRMHWRGYWVALRCGNPLCAGRKSYCNVQCCGVRQFLSDMPCCCWRDDLKTRCLMHRSLPKCWGFRKHAALWW